MKKGGSWLHKERMRPQLQLLHGEALDKKLFTAETSKAWKALTQEERDEYNAEYERQKTEELKGDTVVPVKPAKRKENPCVDKPCPQPKKLRKLGSGKTEVATDVTEKKDKAIASEPMHFRGRLLDKEEERFVETIQHQWKELIQNTFGGITLRSKNRITVNSGVPQILAYLREWQEERRRSASFPGPDLEEWQYIAETTKTLLERLRSGLSSDQGLKGAIEIDENSDPRKLTA